MPADDPYCRRNWSENDPEGGRCQVLMTLMEWAANVIQWVCQWVAMVQAGANPESHP